MIIFVGLSPPWYGKPFVSISAIIKSDDQLCIISCTVGEDLAGKILYNILIDYYNSCKIAIEYDKNLLINFE
jgi:hypothetical protein